MCQDTGEFGMPLKLACAELPQLCLFLCETRDGSYGLLRRPIRYNTPLIRNTRIIQKRIYAISGGTLGLHQPPPTTMNCPPSLQNIITPPGKDPEWHSVVVMGQKGRINEMPVSDARIPRFQQRCPPHPRALEAESQRRCSSMQS